MQGFKSFVDTTRFYFGKGITTIVGPNGSGKSNVSDAIRWVLGEISSKSLRGSKMEDVIFSGAQGRSPASFAEVSLCMDNSDGGLKNDSEEVIVTRHFSRSGNSEYYINKKEVRLRDIYELFLDTGIGRDGYSIIGQGQVAEILSTKSDTRREMIDEAAGVSKYKHKKKDAEKNLSATADNLVRLNDILGEVTSRVEPMRKEAEKTEKYLVLYGEAKTLEVSLWMDEIDGLSKEKEKIQSAYESAKKKLEICENEIAECENGTEELRAKIQQNNEKIEANRDGIKNHEHHMSELSEKKSILQNDLAHFEERLKDINLLCEELTKKLQSEKELFDSEYNKTGELSNKTASLEKEIAASEEQMNALSSKLFNLDFEIGNLALKKELGGGDITELKIQRTSEEAAVSQLKLRVDELNNAGESEALINSTYTERYNSVNKLKTDKEALLEEKLSKLNKCNEMLEAYINDVTSSNNALQELLVKRAETSKHIDMLTRMDNMLEGYAYSVKAVMQAVNSGRLSGIHGPVSKLVTTSDKYAVALEVALGAAAQNIVTEDERAAKSAISELKNTKAGRATFLPIATINGKALSSAEITNKKGYVGIASDLVSYDKKYDGIVRYLLGRTVIAEDIDRAAEIARAGSYRFKVVSLDGQVVNSGGSFTGGSISAKTGMLTRSADIEKLNAELAKIADEISNKQRINSEANNNKAKAEEEISALNSEIIDLRTSLSAINAELVALGENIEGDAERRSGMSLEKEKLINEIEAKEKLINDLTVRISETESALKSDDDAYAEARQRQQDMQNEKDTLQNNVYNMKIELAQALKDLENTQYSLVTLTQSLELESDRMQGYTKQISETQNKIASCKSEIESVSAEIEGGDERYAEMQEIVKALDKENLECDRKITEYSAKLKKCYSEKDNLVRDFTKAETKLESGQTEHDRLISRLFDTYDLTYTTAGEVRIVIENKGEATKRLSYLKGEIKKLGSVNLNAVSEYAELKERYDFLSTQVGDLTKSKEELERIIEDLDTDMKRILQEAMVSINDNFGKIFKELFGGGKAEICFADDANIIDGDIDIFAQPPGKTVNNIQLLSGGERSLISISVYFALIAVTPTPFCIMDEIESALDDVNVDRFAQYAKRFCEKTQFIMITHRRGTMNVADVLYGITMQEKGISKYLTISVDEVENKLGIKL